MMIEAPPNEPVTMDQLRAMRMWTFLSFPAGTADPQESDKGAAFLAILLPLMGGDDAPFEVAPCDWMSVTDKEYTFKCSDGSYCSGMSYGFDCCGANERTQCPMEIPFMCNAQTCGNGHHCCEPSCELHGGYRTCDDDD